MKKRFERKMSFEIVAISDEVMSYEAALKFAEDNGGRLPDPAEMMLIWNSVGYKECPQLAKGVWVAMGNLYFGGNDIGYSYPNTMGVLFPMQVYTCGVVVVKDVED